MHQPEFTSKEGRTIIRVGYRSKAQPVLGVTVEVVETEAGGEVKKHRPSNRSEAELVVVKEKGVDKEVDKEVDRKVTNTIDPIKVKVEGVDKEADGKVTNTQKW